MFQNLRYLHKFLLLLVCGSVLTSCFKDEEVDLADYNELYLNAIAFGTIPRDVHVLSSKGEDSITASTVSATTAYPFTIDHVNNLAYNLDSLPIGTRLDKIVFSTFSITGGQAALKKLSADEDTVYAAADTLDFSHGPREFRLYGIDGISRRTYKVDVRVHNQVKDSLTWHHLTLDDFAAAATTQASTGTTFATSVGTYRLEDGSMLVAADGENFSEDRIDAADKANLPTANLTWAENDSRTDRLVKEIMLYGTVAQADTLAGRIWRRNVDTTGSLVSGWEYLPATFETIYPVAGLHSPHLFAYDKGYLLVGINNDGELSMKYSGDRGRVWRDHSVLRLPYKLQHLTVSRLTAALDASSNLWLLIDGSEVWCGRVHGMNWEEDRRAFDE